MTNHYAHPIDARDLTTRLSSLETTNGNPPSDSTMSSRRPRASSFDSQLSRLPRFTKSATMSTTGSDESQFSRYSQLQVTHAEPSAKTHHESVEVGVGDFSKPRISKRSRRGTNSSVRSTKSAKNEGPEKEFKYYGRHGNQWLFNDFSVTDAVSKGFKKVFGKESDNGDWYENRGR